VILPTLETWAAYGAFAIVAAAAVSAAVLGCSPIARSLMPGGPQRLFKAVWLQGFAMMMVFFAFRFAARAFGVVEAMPGWADNLLSGLSAGLASLVSYFALRRLPWTAKLATDLLEAQGRARRASHTGKA
jgi:hypothetical protein